MRLGVRVFRRSAGLRRNIGLALRISSVGVCVLLALLFAQVAHATVVGVQGPKYAAPCGQEHQEPDAGEPRAKSGSRTAAGGASSGTRRAAPITSSG